jgi:hypothetical protein
LVFAKSRRQGTMLGRVVKRECLIKMLSGFPGVSPAQQGRPHDAMSYQERSGRSLFLGERQELCRKLTHHVIIECHKVRGPKSVEDHEQ